MFEPSVKYQSSTPVRAGIAAASIISLLLGTAVAIPNAQAQTAPSDPAVSTTTNTTTTTAPATAPQDGQETTRVTEHTGPVPYKTVVEVDTNLLAGDYKVETPGRFGEKTVTVTETIVDGTVTDTKFEDTITVEPVTEVIKVGTKQATATDTIEWTVPIPFGTYLDPNLDLKPGETRIVEKGEHGKQSFRSKFVGTDKRAETEETDRIRPTAQVIEYGPALSDKTFVEKAIWTEQFVLFFDADPSLPLGEQVLDQQGENGVTTYTKTRELKDGQPGGEVEFQFTDEKERVDAIIRVGTKPVSTPTTTSPAPTSTENTGSTEDNVSSSARDLLSRFFGSGPGARGPIEWLSLPIGLLLALGGKLIEPLVGQFRP